MIRGGGPGGSGEIQSRALMPYLKKYIPGNPTIMMEFMDGASGRKAANYLYTAKPDGLKIGSAGAMIPGPILGLPGSNYDIDKFIYLGSTETGNPYVLFTRKATGIDSLEKLRSTASIANCFVTSSNFKAQGAGCSISQIREPAFNVLNDLNGLNIFNCFVE
jgi:tripartite-type tricarboxylate transporter receptor subunit TctC